LSDDHPISFVYDATLVTKNPKLKDPMTLPGKVQLDGERNLQCTTCHEDPHEGKFARGCETCHGQEHAFADAANFVHTASFPLTGGHGQSACADCHAKDGPYAIEVLGGKGPFPAARACLDCHASPHSAAFVAEVARGVRAQAQVFDAPIALPVVEKRGINVPSGFGIGGDRYARRGSA